jgi:hypothetical protein
MGGGGNEGGFSKKNRSLEEELIITDFADGMSTYRYTTSIVGSKSVKVLLIQIAHYTIFRSAL